MRERMSDRGFRLMRLVMRAVDHIHPHVPQRAEEFGIECGMTVVDYGCGPGRYTMEFARLVGESGRVLAVDLVELALEETRIKAENLGYGNVVTYLAEGYDSGVLPKTADMVLPSICFTTYRSRLHSSQSFGALQRMMVNWLFPAGINQERR